MCADISMCLGTDCPRKKECYRYTAIQSPCRQSYFIETPLEEDLTCDHFMSNRGRRNTLLPTEKDLQ